MDASLGRAGFNKAFVVTERPRCCAGSIVGTDAANGCQLDRFLIGVENYADGVLRLPVRSLWKPFCSSHAPKLRGGLGVFCRCLLYAALVCSVWREVSDWRENHLVCFLFCAMIAVISWCKHLWRGVLGVSHVWLSPSTWKSGPGSFVVPNRSIYPYPFFVWMCTEI